MTGNSHSIPNECVGRVITVGSTMHSSFFGPVVARRRAVATLAEVGLPPSHPSLLTVVSPHSLQIAKKTSQGAGRARGKLLSRTASDAERAPLPANAAAMTDQADDDADDVKGMVKTVSRKVCIDPCLTTALH
jgi:hypothetical protein